MGVIKGIEGNTVEASPEESHPDSYYAGALPRGYLSISQVTQYMKCGEAYRRRYVLEEQVPSNSYMVQGRGVHKAAEVLHLSIMEDAPISKDEMVQVYVDLHATEIVDAVVPEEEGTADQVKDIGVQLTSHYHRVAMGNGRDDKTGEPVTAVKPVHAERVFRVHLEPDNSPPVPFVGVIDLEEEHAIADLKTKKKASPASDADNSIQLSIYAHVTGKPHVRLDQLIKPSKKFGTRYIRAESMRSKREVAHALDIVAEVASDIASGRFRRTSPDNWWCTEKWCAYWDECRGRKR